MINTEWLQKIANDLDCFFRSNDYPLYADVYADGLFIVVEIQSGDWKHEHLRCQYLVGEFCRNHHLVDVSHTETTTEEDGSDNYSAIHYFVIIPDDV